MKKVLYVGVDLESVLAHQEQLKVFFEGFAEVYGVVIDKINNSPESDIVVISSESLREIVLKRTNIKSDYIVVMKSVFENKQIEKIKEMCVKGDTLIIAPPRTYIKESIKIIEESTGMHLRLIPYYENVKHMSYSEYNNGILIGDEILIPEGVENLINVGWRKISHYTLEKIIDRLFSNETVLRKKLANYAKGMPTIEYERLQAIQLLAETKKRFDSLFDIVVDSGIILMDSDDYILDYNDSICKLMGIKRDIYEGMKLPDIEIFKEIYSGLQGLEDDVTIEIALSPIDKYLAVHKKTIRFQHMEYQKLIFVKQIDFLTGNRNKNRAKYYFNDIITVNDKMKKCVSISEKVAKTENPILIIGETGTGKELFAQAIHNASPRKEKPFIAINCTTLHESLLTSELFGYEKGTFTGALSNGKKGIFEIANGGTVFLDEIGDAPLSVQAELLRVLEEKEIRRIGGEKVIPIDVRFISATNRNVKDMIKGEQFRKDLYYRLSPFIIEIPPIRERREDIRLLTYHFLKKHGYDYKKIDKKVFEVISSLDWDGNVRELRNLVGFMGYMSNEKITVDHIPDYYKKTADSRAVNHKENLFPELSGKDNLICMGILNSLKQSPKGRNSLYEEMKSLMVEISQYDIRKNLEFLQKDGFIKSSSGRCGSSITNTGLYLLNK